MIMSQTECEGVDADDEGRVRVLGGGVRESHENLFCSVEFTKCHDHQFGRQQVTCLVEDAERQIIERVPIYSVVKLTLVRKRRLGRSAWVERQRPSVCPQHNSTRT